MKAFDIVAAQNGAEICTRDGREARVICWDMEGQPSGFRIVALVKDDRGVEQHYGYGDDGHAYVNTESGLDLMMKSVRYESWVNVYRNEFGSGIISGGYASKDEAIADSKRDDLRRVDTVKVEWEE